MEDENTTAKHQKRPILRSWSPDDGKLLVITFIATVAANLVTVLFVGLAIVLARGFHPKGHTFLSYSVFIAATATTIVGVIVVVDTLRRIRHTQNVVSDVPSFRAALTASRVVMIVIGLFMAFMGSIFILTLVGIAAGIR